MTCLKSATIPLRVGLVAGALSITGCLNVDGYLGVFTEGGSDSSGDGASSDDPGSGAGSTSGDGGEPGTGTAAPTSTGGSDEEGESGERTCPKGQPRLAPLWTTHLVVDPDTQYVQNTLAVLSDGRIAVGAGHWQSNDGTNNGVLWVDGDGAPQDFTFGPFEQPGYDAIGLRRAADDSLVALGFTVKDGEHIMRFTRIPGDGSPATVVEADLGHMAWPRDFELLGDSAVVVGREFDEDPFVRWVAKVDVASGALEWEVSPDSFRPILGLEVAVGPNGEIVAGHAQAGDGAEFKLWRIGADGSVLWTADLLEPPAKSFELIDLLITPGEQVVALVQHVFPARVTAHAVGLAEGEARWETEVAVEDDSGSPAFGRALLDPDALSLPIARGPTPYFKGEIGDPLTASLVRLSFTGEILDDTPLPLTDLAAGSRTLMPARGKCGDLLLLHANGAETEYHRLWSFAP